MIGKGLGLAVCVAAISAALACAQAAAQEARVIVKFKDSATSAKSAAATDARIAKLAEVSGTSLRKVREMGLGAEVLTAGGIVGDAAAEALASKLASSPDVEFAEADHLRHATQAYPVDDTYVGSQTYLADGPTNINAFDAWTVTHGSPDIVVAVIDTGYRPHVDLAGRFLPGYDMISDPAIANDGDGRDPDASDPGDWVTSADLPSLPASCKVTTSSWHGTSVAGIIAADTDNDAYLAGIDWNATILPVRVLGRCGGYDSDIVDGILWAAGLSVPGVPDNLHPAQVLNLSLGGEGPCHAAYSLAILAAYANGFTRSIVVAAGNSSEDAANATPANCPGVIRVASTTTRGSLAPYSNYGPSITLSAPGGSPYSTLFNYSVPVLSNSGTHGPVADSIGFEGGTSFSAPMVSGTISMMLAVNPALSPDQVVSILTSTASAFVPGSNCTTSKCGAGIVNVGGAVRAASAVQTNYQGLWWASPAGSESGWGLNVAHQGNLIFATWFTYDSSAKALWLSMTGTEGPANTFSGQMVETHGPAFSAMPFNPALVTRTVVGSGTLTFTDINDGMFNYTVNGVTQTKAITRDAFGPVPVCTFGGLANLAQATNYQDIWWASPPGSESGWGINLTQEGNAIFGTWFTYDVDGTPLWLSVTATPTTASKSAAMATMMSYGSPPPPMTPPPQPKGAQSVWTGQLVRTTGPVFSAVPFNPALVTRNVVGTATFTFSDGANGTFAYTVNGVSQVKNFTREVFVSPGTACH